MNDAAAAYLRKLASDRAAYIEDIKKFRRYAEGDTPDVISQKQKELILGNDFFGTATPRRTFSANRPKDLHYKINVCDLIVSTEADRLNVRNIEIVAPSAQRSQDLTRLVRRWRKQSRMDLQDKGLYYAACRDADAYLIVEYDARLGRPVITMNKAFDGETGADMIYLDNNPMKPLYATKRWVDEQITSTGERIQRLNIYLPDRVLKLVMGQSGPDNKTQHAGWRPYTDEGEIDEVGEYTLNGFTFEAGIMWWTTTQDADGEPMGLPVFHFPHNPNGEAYGRSTLADVVPDLQDRLNRSAAALEYANLFAGFNVPWITGYRPPKPDETPNKNTESRRRVEAIPGMVMYLEDSEATVGQLAATDLRQLIEAKEACFRDIATLSKTPLPMLNPTGQISAEGTLQQQEAPLVVKVENAQTAFGNVHEDVARYMLKLEVVLGQPSLVGLTLREIDDLEINCEWKDAKTRNEQAEITNAQTKREMGVPDEQLWSEIGYSPDQIEKFKTSQQVKRTAVISQLFDRLPAGGASQNTASQPVSEMATATVG